MGPPTRYKPIRAATYTVVIFAQLLVQFPYLGMTFFWMASHQSIAKGSEIRDIFNNRQFFLEKPLVIQAGVLYLLMRLFV